MDQILGDIAHCLVYVDDVLIASPDTEFHLCHVPGAENVVSDALARPSIDPDTVDVLSTLSPHSVTGISYLEMSKFQQSRPKIQNLHQSSAMKVVSISFSSSPGLLCDVSTGVHHPLVPEPMR